ncbi:MAG: serine/threonine protein kinase, partial [Myxococcota bacterium]|nr:serine/threonine protein kinase [Myxococcota bacterium]
MVNRLLGGSVTHLRVAGVIDETFDPSLFSADLRGHVLLDVGSVERLSSFGVRKWMEFTRQVPVSVTKLYLMHLPPFFVDQLNMVDGFAGVADVVSLLAPYTCTHCGEDRVRIVDLREDRETIASGSAPEHSCPVCTRPLQFADQPGEFFDYARQISPAPLDPAVERYLSLMRPTTPLLTTGNVKVVEGDITFLMLPAELTADLNVRRLGGGLEGRVLYDFSAVRKVDPAAAPKMKQLLEAASATATVMLWRVPPAALETLSRMPLGNWTIGSLYLPGECCNCGQKMPQRVTLSRFVEVLDAGEELLLDCPICGGLSLLPKLRDFMEFLRAVSTSDEGGRGFDDFTQIESRALSQYFNQSTSRGSASGSNGSGGITPQGSSANKFQIIRRLGQGGMAEVFLAKQEGMQGFEKYVVIKKVLENFANSPEFVQMLFAEARANARLNHPNVVQTYDVGMLNGSAYIAMEYVRGPDVKRVLHALRKEKRMMPVEIALRIVADTAAGLHYAHSYVDPAGTPHPMVHRDVSPHNILVSLDGVIKLSDFGIAKVAGEGDDSTRAGTFKGKIHYVSPEAVALQPLDGRNDVFGLGVTLFEMLTGRLPFKRDSEAASLHAIVYDAAPDPASFNPQIPPEVSQVVLRALEKDQNRRTPTAARMRDEIDAVMAKLGMTATSALSVAQYIQGLFAEFGNSSGSLSSPGASFGGNSVASSPGPSLPAVNRPKPGTGSRPTGPAPVPPRAASPAAPPPVPRPAVARPPPLPPEAVIETDGPTSVLRASGIKAAIQSADSSAAQQRVSSPG